MANRSARRAVIAQARRRGSWDWEQRAIQPAARELYPAIGNIVSAFVNDTYSVQLYLRETEWGEVTHLAVKRHDAQPIRSWRDMQRIKSELVGAERVGVEVYPSESELVDDANLYHLFVLPIGFELPFGIRGHW